MPQSFLVFCSHGSAWVTGKPSREQPYWDDHAAFMDKLFEAGKIVLAGPYADYSGALVIVKAADAASARGLFDDDPWMLKDVLLVDEVKGWLIFLDSRKK